MKRSHALLLVLGAALVARADAPPAPPPPTFSGSTEVTLVEVPVHVVAKNGLPVRGLTKDDFELFDDGKRVEIRDLDAVDLDDFSKDPNTPREMPLPPAARRHFLLLFDLSFSQPVNMARARSAAKDFIQNGMKNGDFGAVATFDVERGLKLVLSFTADHDQLSYAVGTLGLPSLTQPMADPLALTAFSSALSARSVTDGARGGSLGDAEMAEIIEAVARNSAKQFDAYQRGRVSRMMDSMGDLARTLNSVQGRKHIVYFSEGFDSKLVVGDSSNANAQMDQIASGELWKINNEDRFGYSALQKRVNDVFEMFRRSDCVIHSVDVAGLRGTGGDVRASSSTDTTSASVTGSHGRGEDSLFMFAHETGGEVYKDSNDLHTQLDKLQKQTSVIYLLVFQPTKLKEPGRFHDLKVKVHSPGAHVSARAGYFEPRPFSALSPMEKRLATAQLIAYGLPKTDLPARVLAAPFRVGKENRAVVPVIVEIPGDKLVADATGNKLDLEVYAYATDAQLRVKDFVSQHFGFDLQLLKKTLNEGGVKYYGSLFLPPGNFWLKVLVRNTITGRTGLQILPITVPEYDHQEDPYLLPPLFQESPGKWVMVKGAARALPGGGDYPFVFEGQSFIPAAGPRLSKADHAKVCLFAYESGKAPLEVEGHIKSPDGKDHGDGKLKLVKTQPEAAGMQRMLYSFEVADLDPGSYSLVVTVKNPKNGREGQSALGFQVR
jgi:VWFA-related protein